MKTSAILRIVVWSVVALLLIGILICAIAVPNILKLNVNNINRSNFFNYYYANESKYNVSSAEIEAVGFKSIDIEWISGSVTVKPYDGDKVIIDEGNVENEDYKLRYAVINDCLTIKACKPQKWNFSHFPKKELTVFVPESLAKSLVGVDVNTASASVNIEGLKATDLDINTASGPIDVKNSEFVNLDFETVSGEIYTDDVTAHNSGINTVSGSINIKGSFDEIDFEGVSGTVNYTAVKAPRELDAKTVSGDVTVNLPANDGFEFSFHTVSGKLNSEFPLTSHNGDSVYGNGSGDYDFETVSGDLNIKKYNF